MDTSTHELPAALQQVDDLLRNVFQSELERVRLIGVLCPPSLTEGDEAIEINGVLGQVLECGVAMPRRLAVRGYLQRHPDMVGVVQLASAIAAEHVKSAKHKTKLSLERYRDPEIEDEYLALYVRSEAYDASVREMIRSISESVRPELRGKSGWLVVTTDFQNPG